MAVVPAHLHPSKSISSDRVILERGGIIVDDKLFFAKLWRGSRTLRSRGADAKCGTPPSDTTIHHHVLPGVSTLALLYRVCGCRATALGSTIFKDRSSY